MKENESVILHGGGEHAKVVLDCLLSLGVHVAGIFDPKYSGELYGIPQMGEYNPSFLPTAKAIIAIGSNSTRKKVASNTSHEFTNAIHSSAILSKRLSMGVGNMILHGAIIQTQATLGNHVIINTGARVDHECIIGDYVHIAPGATLAGVVSVGEGTFVGAGATIINGKKIGAWCTIGAGAVVITDIPDFAVVVGNPARIIKYNNA
jgi:sugar O-acyltransferase (sialic acid O-acetyltransferase NeuD family)